VDVSERAYDVRPRVLNGVLLPVFFGLAIAAGVVVGGRSDSFWVGLLAFMVAWKIGRVLRRLIRGLVVPAVRAALWPAGATLFAILFISVGGVSKWLGVFLLMVVPTIMQTGFAASFLPKRVGTVARWAWVEDWDIPGLDEAIQGRWTRKDPAE
jgi:hypothetical protein